MEGKIGLENISKFEDISAQLSNYDMRDLEIFSDLASNVNGDYLEIGSDQGGSAIRILQQMPINRTLFCMDFWNWNNNYNIFCDNMKRHNKWHLVVPIVGDFRAKLQYFNIDQKFAFVFIDNDHTYSNTALPVLYFWKKISIGGYMLFHDYQHPSYPGVEEFLSLCAKEAWSDVVQDRWGLFCLRKKDNIPKVFFETIKMIFASRFAADLPYLQEAIDKG